MFGNTRKVGIFSFLVFWSFLTNAQQVVGSSGNSIQSNECTLNWTLGEPVSFVIIGENYCLTQGFQQSSITITEVETPIQLVYKIKVYPNPVLSVLTIQTNEPDLSNVAFKLFDSMGRVVKEGEILSSNTQVSMERLIPALYYLKIYKRSGAIKTFKVIKQ